MSKRDLENEFEDKKVIVPGKALKEISKILSGETEKEVFIYFTERHILFEFDETLVLSRLIDGEYIDYNRIILRNHRITVYADRESVISALEHAALITEEKVAGSVRSHVKLLFEENLLKISAISTMGSTYDEVDVEHEGDDLLIAFNNRFLIDSLRASSAEKVKISMTSALTSINIEPLEVEEGKQELFMLLPVRMKE